MSGEWKFPRYIYYETVHQNEVTIESIRLLCPSEVNTNIRLTLILVVKHEQRYANLDYEILPKEDGVRTEPWIITEPTDIVLKTTERGSSSKYVALRIHYNGNTFTSVGMKLVTTSSKFVRYRDAIGQCVYIDFARTMSALDPIPLRKRYQGEEDQYQDQEDTETEYLPESKKRCIEGAEECSYICECACKIFKVIAFTAEIQRETQRIEAETAQIKAEYVEMLLRLDIFLFP